MNPRQIKARDEYRIYGSRFTRAGSLIEHVDLRFLSGVTVEQACTIAEEMRRERETDCFLIRMEQLFDVIDDVLPGGLQ